MIFIKLYFLRGGILNKIVMYYKAQKSFVIYSVWNMESSRLISTTLHNHFWAIKSVNTNTEMNNEEYNECQWEEKEIVSKRNTASMSPHSFFSCSIAIFTTIQSKFLIVLSFSDVYEWMLQAKISSTPLEWSNTTTPFENLITFDIGGLITSLYIAHYIFSIYWSPNDTSDNLLLKILRTLFLFDVWEIIVVLVMDTWLWVSVASYRISLWSSGCTCWILLGFIIWHDTFSKY